MDEKPIFKKYKGALMNKKSMEAGSSVSYFKNASPALNDSDDKETDLQVNCCGESVTDYYFKEDYSRRGRNDFYIIHVTSGVIKLFLSGDEQILRKDNFICISEHTPFSFYPVAPEDRILRYYWIHFTGYGARDALQKSDIMTNTVYKLKNSKSVLDQYEKLFYESRTCRKNLEYVLSVELRNAFLRLGRARYEDTSPRLDVSVSYIHSHLRDNLSVESLAAMEFLGVSRYRELFREVMGCSPSEYIVRLRIMKAKDLLTQPSLAIAEIADRVGYRDRLYFQRVFKKYVGMTPGEYRERQG